MRAISGRTLGRIGRGIVITAVASALLWSAADRSLLGPPKPLAYEVAETASITELPSTIGSADSDLYFMSQADIDRTLDTLKAMGVQNVRIVIPWAGVQLTEGGEYRWGTIDRMVDAAAARNMGILAVLNSTPDWAGRPDLSGHPDPNVFAAFAAAAADRYEGRISAYEVWNEPNSLIFWNPVDPEAYTRMLQVAYRAIKAEDESAVVVGGIVVTVFSFGRATINPEDFVERMYAAGAHGYFDALSVHPYHYTLKFSEGERHPLSPLNQIQAIRELMNANGDGDLRIWATEYGLPTAEIAPGEVVTEQEQADFIEDFLHSWQGVDGAGPIFIYSTRDTFPNDPDLVYNFGFFYNNWTPKLSAQVIEDFIRGLDPQRPIREAIAAVVRVIADVTVRVIDAAVEVFSRLVDVTVRVITGLVDLGVRLVQGVVDAAAAVVDCIVDAISNRVGENSVPAADEAVQPQSDNIAASTLRSASAPADAANETPTAPVTSDDTVVDDAVMADTVLDDTTPEPRVIADADPTTAGSDEAQDVGETGEDAVVTGADIETSQVEPKTPPISTGDTAGIESADSAPANVDATVSPKETTAEAAGTEGEGTQDDDEDATS